ncbi:MAG: hypothetical protein WC481_04275 [Candidatus Omnitrophota bacterium]
MKKWLKITLWGVGALICTVILLLGAFLYLWTTQNERDNRNPAKQTEMKQATLEWARLAPFPKEATNFNIKTEGSMFTRSFRGSFSAPKNVIESWIQKSPGFKDAKIEKIDEGIQKYIITPGGGANWAEVTINYLENKVDFYVCWS